MILVSILISFDDLILLPQFLGKACSGYACLIFTSLGVRRNWFKFRKDGTEQDAFKHASRAKFTAAFPSLRSLFTSIDQI
jgi:hypothetical protein